MKKVLAIVAVFSLMLILPGKAYCGKKLVKTCGIRVIVKGNPQIQQPIVPETIDISETEFPGGSLTAKAEKIDSGYAVTFGCLYEGSFMIQETTVNQEGMQEERHVLSKNSDGPVRFSIDSSAKKIIYIITSI